MKTKSRYQKKYAHLGRISSLRELREARTMVDRDLRKSKKRIRRNYDAAMEMFSYKSLVCGILNKADDVQALVRYAMYGYDVVNGIMVARRKKKEGCCGGGCDSE